MTDSSCDAAFCAILYAAFSLASLFSFCQLLLHCVLICHLVTKPCPHCAPGDSGARMLVNLTPAPSPRPPLFLIKMKFQWNFSHLPHLIIPGFEAVPHSRELEPEPQSANIPDRSFVLQDLQFFHLHKGDNNSWLFGLGIQQNNECT